MLINCNITPHMHGTQSAVHSSLCILYSTYKVHTVIETVNMLTWWPLNQLKLVLKSTTKCFSLNFIQLLGPLSPVIEDIGVFH